MLCRNGSAGSAFSKKINQCTWENNSRYKSLLHNKVSCGIIFDRMSRKLLVYSYYNNEIFRYLIGESL